MTKSSIADRSTTLAPASGDAAISLVPPVVEPNDADGDGAAPRAMPLVLVVDDDPRMRQYLRAALKQARFRVVDTDNGRDALALAASHNPDLVLLDLALPDTTGIQVTAKLREWSAAPILLISANGDERGKIAALDTGADDYLTKPFGTGELLARLRVWLRHAQRASAGRLGSLVQIGDLRVDLAKRDVRVGDRQVHLTPTEFKLLATLVKQPGKVLTHEQLLVAVWGASRRRENHYVRVFMQQLRQKIEADPARPRYLLTEAGVGYMVHSET